MSKAWMVMVGVLVSLTAIGCNNTSTSDLGRAASADALSVDVLSPEQSDSAVIDVPRPGDPSSYGPHPIGYLQTNIADPDKDGRRLPTHVWYPAAGFDEANVVTYIVGKLGPFELEMPSTRVQDSVPVAAGSWPMVIFSHGYGGIPTQSIDLCERLASHGFVVVSAAHTGNTTEDDFNGTSVDREEALADRPRDIRTLINAFTSATSAPELLAEAIDPAKIGVTGHSFGGYTALTAAAGHADSGMAPEARVTAIAPICPDSSPFVDAELSAVTIPVLLLGATIDEDTPIEPHITRPYSLMEDARRIRVDVLEATHTHFAAVCTIAAAMIELGLTPDTWEALGAGSLLEVYEPTCGEDAFPMDKAMRIQAHYIVSFFKAFLEGDLAWEGFLSAEYASSCEPDVEHFAADEPAELSAPPCEAD